MDGVLSGFIFVLLFSRSVTFRTLAVLTMAVLKWEACLLGKYEI